MNPPRAGAWDPLKPVPRGFGEERAFKKHPMKSIQYSDNDFPREALCSIRRSRTLADAAGESLKANCSVLVTAAVRADVWKNSSGPRGMEITRQASAIP